MLPTGPSVAILAHRFETKEVAGRCSLKVPHGITVAYTKARCLLGGVTVISSEDFADYYPPLQIPSGLSKGSRRLDPKGLESRAQRVSSYRYGFRVRIARNGFTAPVVNVSGPHFLFEPKRRRPLGQLTGSFKKSGLRTLTEQCPHVLMPPAAATDAMPHMHCLSYVSSRCAFHL